MLFDIVYENKKFNKVPIYNLVEKSFIYEPFEDSDFSLMLGASYVGLDINIKTMLAVQVSGYSPKSTWKLTSSSPPNADSGSLVLFSSEILFSGTGIDYYEFNKNVFYNKRNGWICIGDTSWDNSNACCVAFENNTIAVVKNKKLVALWIKPIFQRR